MQDCWSFTCCLSWTLGSSSKCITVVDVHLSWLNLFHFHILEGSLLVILIDCMIFLSPFVDATRMSMLTVSFLAQLHNSLLIECFCLTYDLNGIKSRINRHLCFKLFVLLFLVTPFVADEIVSVLYLPDLILSF